MVLMEKNDDGTNQRMIPHVARPLPEGDSTAEETIGHKVSVEDPGKELGNTNNRPPPDPKQVLSECRVRQEHRQNPSVSGVSSRDLVLTVLTKG